MTCGTSRYDDTNPEAEKKEYIDHIEEIARWMGWEPFKVSWFILVGGAYCLFEPTFFFFNFFFKRLTALHILQITYTSDYFQELYELAVELIKRGHAYVDHQVGIQTYAVNYYYTCLRFSFVLLNASLVLPSERM